MLCAAGRYGASEVRASRLEAALDGARTGEQVLSAVARAVWHNDRGGARCPSDAIPSETVLRGWVPVCPDAVVDEASDALFVVFGAVAHWDVIDFLLDVDAPLARRFEERLVVFIDHGVDGIRCHTVREVHAAWRVGSRSGRARHPLAPLVGAWQAQPRLIRPDLDGKRRIIPARLAMFDGAGSDARGRLFSPAAHWQGARGVLPGFGAEVEVPIPALPLALYELGVNRWAPGPAAPVPLRVLVEGTLAVRLDDRVLDRPVAFEVPLRDFVRRLWPGRRQRPVEFLPAIEAARAALASRDAGIPWPGGVRWAVTITNLPLHADDAVRLVVDLPPSAGDGPQVSDRLHLYGPKEGKVYRTLLNLAYWWHEPGRTVVPVGRGRRRHWIHSRDPKRYRRVTDRELLHLVFPRSARRNRRELVAQAHGVVERLKADGELVVVGDRLLPPVVRSGVGNGDAAASVTGTDRVGNGDGSMSETGTDRVGNGDAVASNGLIRLTLVGSLPLPYLKGRGERAAAPLGTARRLSWVESGYPPSSGSLAGSRSYEANAVSRGGARRLRGPRIGPPGGSVPGLGGDPDHPPGSGPHRGRACAVDSMRETSTGAVGPALSVAWSGRSEGSTLWARACPSLFHGRPEWESRGTVAGACG